MERKLALRESRVDGEGREGVDAGVGSSHAGMLGHHATVVVTAVETDIVVVGASIHSSSLNSFRVWGSVEGKGRWQQVGAIGGCGARNGDAMASF